MEDNYFSYIPQFHIGNLLKDLNDEEIFYFTHILNFFEVHWAI